MYWYLSMTEQKLLFPFKKNKQLLQYISNKTQEQIHASYLITGTDGQISSGWYDIFIGY